MEFLEEESRKMPVVIFKHSTRCGISRMVLNNFEKNYDLNEEDVKLYYLDLLAHREVSDAVASRYGIRHESPQLLILKDGEVADHASHHSIETEMVKGHL